MEENKDTENIIDKPIVEKSKTSFSFELVMDITLIALLTGLSLLFYHFDIFKFDPDKYVDLSYSASKTLHFQSSLVLNSGILSIISMLILILVQLFLHPSGLKPVYGKKHLNLIKMYILDAFGILASAVLPMVLSGFNISNGLTLFITLFLVLGYETLIYKLYMENRTYSNKLFWEIFRFAIVGLIAAVFDFLISFIFQFVVFNGGTSWYVTGISTICGFIVGVVINYLMSTYMVYKNSKSNTSKTVKGMILFLILAIIGLVIGIVIQYLLYDLFNLKLGISFLSYPICFVIRTLIVMVYNYISRKIFIYK